jgi:hypothetical protein
LGVGCGHDSDLNEARDPSFSGCREDRASRAVDTAAADKTPAKPARVEVADRGLRCRWLIQQTTHPKPRVMPVDPVTAAEDMQPDKRLQDCQIRHAALQVSGVVRSMGPLERFQWCEAYGG